MARGKAKAKLTQKQARASGFIVDSSCYPPIAYHGPRFAPHEIRECFTELEAQMLEALELLVDNEPLTALSTAERHRIVNLAEVAIRSARGES